MIAERAAVVTVKALAKINLTLRVLGVREDGYHALRTTFQSLALHDTLTFHATRGPFQIACDDPECPTDASNLVWRAAEAMWRAAGRKGQPRGVRVNLVKRIPMQSGLGGGSSDAAAAMRALARLWQVDVASERLHEIAASLGADVPYFLLGGTALGVDRGDLLFPLVDAPARWVTVVIPAFGVSTRDAYAWWDRAHDRVASGSDRNAGQSAASGNRGRSGRVSGVGFGSLHSWLTPGEARNDLEPTVCAQHPEIGHLVRALRRSGASHAAMSGSGSALFGLFESRQAAETSARALNARARRVQVTRTVKRAEYQRMTLQ
jgi:4-diphosphocytidyl-2-C-methyl-D-erythritol kinase